MIARPLIGTPYEYRRSEATRRLIPLSENPEMTPSSFIPGARITKYLGRVNMHLIKEKLLVCFSNRQPESLLLALFFLAPVLA